MNSTAYNRIRGLILDMDGVLWRGEQQLGDLPTIFQEMRAHNWKIAFATNNSTRNVAQYVERLAAMGVEVHPDQVVNSALATAFYLKELFPQGGRIYVIGHPPLAQTLAESGFRMAEENVDAVVVGLDRMLTYEKLCRATLLIRAGAKFIATNPDRTFPVPEGQVPGAGAIAAAIAAAADVEPIFVGKPSPAMYRVALEKMGLGPADIVVVGDRLETDIAGAQALGSRSAVVLTGVSSLEAVKSWRPEVDFIADDLTSLLPMLVG